MKVVIFYFLLLLGGFQSCSYCKLLGETALGNNFSLVESDKDHIALIYCTSKPCCDVGIPIIPSKIIKYNSDSKWIIAKSVDSSKESYWIIDKDFKIKFEYDNDMKSKILKHVTAPLDSIGFYKKSKEGGIHLNFKN